MSKVGRLLVVGSLAMIFVASGSTVATAAVMDQGGVGCGPMVTTISKVRSAANVVRSPSGPNWEVAGRGPATLTLSKSVSVSNSFTGSAQVSATVLSEDVGFSVTAEYTTATSYEYSVPAGQTWVVRADTVYASKTYAWTSKRSCNSGLVTSSSGTGVAYRFLRLQYRAYRS